MGQTQNKKVFLSYVISPQTPGYGGGESLLVETTKNMLCGDSCNQVRFTMSNHLGTHIDFPHHFDQAGRNVQDYSAEDFHFEKPYLLVVLAEENEIIDLEKYLDAVPEDTDFLIIKTGFCLRRGTESYWKYNPGISVESAESLRKKRPKIRAIGFDFISLTSYQNRPLGRKAHVAFLKGHQATDQSIWIVEDMDLSALNVSPKSLIVVPLRCEKFDGAPVTIIATL